MTEARRRGSGRGGAVLRALKDAEAGRTWRAVGRLRDRLRDVGHDDEALQVMGRIRLDMGDACAAGRWWMLSGASGEDVERSVDRYVAAFGGDVTAAIEASPGAGRDCAVKDLAPAAVARLDRLGFALPGDASQTLLRTAPPDGTWQARAKNLGCLVLFWTFVAALVVGLLAWVAVGVRAILTW